MYLRGLVRPGACLFLLPVRATIRPRSAQSPSPKINVLNRSRRITRAKAPRVLRSDLLSSPPGKISIRYARSMSGTFVRVPCPALSCDQWYADNHHVCIVPPEVINTSQPAPGQSLKAVTSFIDMVQRAARDARPSGTCHVCLPPPSSHILLMPPLVCLTDPPFKQQEVAKVLLSSDSSTGPVVCEALGALP